MGAHRSKKHTFWALKLKNVIFDRIPPTYTPNLIYISAGKCRGPKSLNRFRLSQFVQVLLHFYWFGPPGSGEGAGGWGVSGGIRGYPQMHAHTHTDTQTHRHTHTCIYMLKIHVKKLQIATKMFIIINMCVCACACMHIHTCMGVEDLWFVETPLPKGRCVVVGLMDLLMLQVRSNH